MSSTELLASKIVVLEEQPQIPAIAPLPSAVLMCIGITERGPIGDPQLVTSFDEYERLFGGFTAAGQVALAINGFFQQGGSYAWVVRTCHYTDLTSPSSYTATAATIALSNSGATATPAVVGPGSDAAPFVMDPADTFVVDVTGAPTTATFNAAPATLTDAASYPLVALVAQTMGITIAGANGGAEQTLTAAGGETTALQVAALINDQLLGVHATVSTGHVVITSDIEGTDASIQVTTAGTLNAILVFPTSEATGTGNVGNIKAVTAAEVETVVEAAIATVAVTYDGTGHITVTSVATGAGVTLEVNDTTDVDFGLDHTLHSGAAAAPQPTLQFDGKTPGAYGNAVALRIAAASSGVAAEFNLAVLQGGVVKEVFPNVTMDSAASNYVETVVNHADFGSNLVTATDLALGLSVLQRRPVNGTSALMSTGDDGLGSIADADYLGNQAGPTGLYCFDRVTNGTILIVPGLYSLAIHQGMLDYCEITRNGGAFAVLDPQASRTATQMVAYMDTGLLNYSEYGAIYWPRIKVSNPSTTVYGDGATITVPPSGWVAGKYAANDQRIGGVYESPAGVDGWGVLRGCLGVEDDPAGTSRHQVLDERWRDIVYPKRINPITLLDGYPWHIDGGRTLKASGNFPNVGERRGVIFIENALRQGLVILKHRFNNRANRRKANRIITAFLLRELGKGAFRSQVPSEAFFVDTSDQLNPLVNEIAGIMTVRIGLATNKPAEFIVLLVTQDTRALAEELASAA